MTSTINVIVGNTDSSASEISLEKGGLEIVERLTPEWLQLCDEAMTCIYLDNAESARDKAGQKLTFYGKFLAHDVLRYTPVRNVLVVAAT